MKTDHDLSAANLGLDARASGESKGFRPIAHGELKSHQSAFSLVEVMVALAIFFMAVFTILGLMSTLLRNARILQNKKGVDAGLVAAQLTLTNKLTEEVESGDFGDMYPDYNWTRDTYEVSTNGLYQVDIIVQRGSGSGPVESKMSILLFRPESGQGSLTRRRIR